MKSKVSAGDIIDRLCGNGFQAYYAGGAVRDMLLGERPSDFDVVTNARPAEIMALFKGDGVRCVGVDFQVCLVGDTEVATYRDQAGGGSYGTTLEGDLLCRDLTINAIAMCRYTGDIIDVAGGRRDLKRRVIRFTGSARGRIGEDPLRIIRACRFKAMIEGTFALDTFEALKKFSPRLGSVAPERIRLEILKAMALKHPSLFFTDLYDIGALGYVFPSLSACYGQDGGPYHNETVWEHVMIAGDVVSPRFPLLRLAMFLHDVGKPVSASCREGGLTFVGHEKTGSEIVAEEMSKLMFSNHETGYVTGIIRCHMRNIDRGASPRAVRRAMRTFGDEGVDYRDWLRGRIADRKANKKREDYPLSDIRHVLEKILGEINPPGRAGCFSIKDLALDGNAVMEILGIGPGPRVGVVLKALLDRVIADPETNTGEGLILLIKQMGHNASGGPAGGQTFKKFDK